LGVRVCDGVAVTKCVYREELDGGADEDYVDCDALVVELGV
jgi:hypothetical protein